MIRVDNLTKIYQNHKGIKDVSLMVKQGEVFGLLGPNGAGKTTMIRILMGFIRQKSGTAQINGLDCWSDSRKIKEIVSYLPGEINFLEKMSGRDFLELMMGMHNKANLGKNITILAERLDLNLDQPIKKMSKGMKQKVGIIYAFLLDADLMILDEPTSGLDPLMQQIFIDLVLEEKSKGKTIFISSHMFSEIERTCDRVGIIRSGELAAVKTIDELQRNQKRTFYLEVGSEEEAQLLREGGFETKSKEGCKLTINVSGDLNSFFKYLSVVNVKAFIPRTTDLEEAFMEYYRVDAERREIQ